MTPSALLAKLAVSNVVVAERAARDRADWLSMLAAFTPNSTVRLSWFDGSGPEFVAASQRMHDTAMWQSTHRLGPVHVTVHGVRALAESDVAIEIRRPVDGVDVDVTAYGRLLYRAVETTTGWLLAGLTMIYQRDTLVPVLPGKIPALDENELSSHRPSYRYLSYLTARSGGNPRSDLPGSDRPELVDDITTAETYWLRQQH